MIEITAIEKAGDPLTKRISLGRNGELGSDSSRTVLLLAVTQEVREHARWENPELGQPGKGVSMNDAAGCVPGGMAIAVTFGTRSTNRTWTDRRHVAWPDLVKMLTTHSVGPKDGPCIVPAVFRGTRRRKADADAIAVVFLDSDTGSPIGDLADAVRQRGWAGVVVSTHSHLTTTTRVKHSHWLKYQNEHPGATEAMFLTDQKSYLPLIAAGATVGPAISEKDGKNYSDFVYFQHQPCPKFRVVLPLLQPWRRKDYDSQDEANAAWKERIEAVASALGLQHDQSCTDTSRLFYLPRRPAHSAPAEAQVIEGVPCDLFSLPLAKPAGLFASGASGAKNGKTTKTIFGMRVAEACEFTDRDTGEVFDLRGMGR